MYELKENIATVEEPWLLPEQVSIKPFLKWAGGKTQLLPELSKHVPNEYNKYIEPFIGGGAFYFHLNPREAVIADLNYELVLTYKTIKSSVEEVISLLKTFKNEEEFFYEMRANNPEKLSTIERTARLPNLNKKCFNDLY